MTETTSLILNDLQGDGELNLVFPLVRCYGREAAEKALQTLRRAGKVRLVAVSDFRDFSADELADSIEGVEETIGYVRLVA